MRMYNQRLDRFLMQLNLLIKKTNPTLQLIKYRPFVTNFASIISYIHAVYYTATKVYIH